MITSNSFTQRLLIHLNNNKIATIEDLKIALNTQSRMTVFRWLRKMDYISSCSHRGKYYSLQQLAKYNQYGLWIYKTVLFSEYGTLKKTLEILISKSEKGYTASELNKFLNIKVDDALLELQKNRTINRKKISGVYVYLSTSPKCAKKQELFRNDSIQYQDGLKICPEVLMIELKAALIIFFSTLNEKQRRLYAGFESLKVGYGGDTQIAELLNIDKRTVAKGRKELLDGKVDLDTVRETGGGRKQTKKKSQK
jgi:hypothetical protein